MAELVVLGKSPWQVMIREFRPGYPDQLIEVATFTRRELSFSRMMPLSNRQKRLIIDIYGFYAAEKDA